MPSRAYLAAMEVEPATPTAPSPCVACTVKPEAHAKPFISFISENPTVYHAVSYFAKQLESEGFTKLSERELWTDKLSKGGKYYFDRNGSGLMAFTIGGNYKPGNGVAIIASHIDAVTTKLKPVSTKPTRAGFVQLGVAPYAGALNQTWFDRDLGIGGRVLVKDSNSGKIKVKLVRLDWPIARIPTIAPHFGIPAEGQANRETRMVPIIGLDNSDLDWRSAEASKPAFLGGAGTFAATQPPGLVKAIAGEMGIEDCTSPMWKTLSLLTLCR
jgi:aminopeptidase I